MENIVIIYLLPVIAGLSTILGIVPTYLKINSSKIINYSITLTIGILLIVSIFSLIPESFRYLNKSIIESIILVFSFVSLGILINFTLDKIIPLNDKLYRIGILSMLAISLHNIPEGIITVITSSTNIKLGITTTLAIMLHNIPEGISIAVPIYYSTGSHKRALFYTAISGFSELFGVLISLIFLKDNISNFELSLILGVTAGIMLYLVFSLIIKKED